MPGPTPRPRSRVRSGWISTRITTGERAIIHAEARRRGMDPSAYVRWCALRMGQR